MDYKSFMDTAHFIILNPNNDYFSIISSVSSAIATIIALFVVILNIRNTKIQKKNQDEIYKKEDELRTQNLKTECIKRITDIHIKFQDNIRHIQEEFSDYVNNPDIWKPSEHEIRYIGLYWYSVFDEWFICTKIHPKLLKPLWDNYYINGVRSALRLPQFYEKLLIIFERDSAFLGCRNEFRDEINRIHEIQYQKPSKII